MGLGWKDWKLSDLVYGVVAPLIVVLVIVGLSQLGSIFGLESVGAIIGITNEIEELVLIVGVPMVLGLVWNRWAGGASGFLLGSLYALYWADQYNLARSSGFNLSAGAILLGYVVSAMFIGYVAGSLNKRSEDFRRMVISGLIAGTLGGLLLFVTLQLSPANLVTGVAGFLLTVLPRVICGVIIPAIAKVFMWYGLAIGKRSNSES